MPTTGYVFKDGGPNNELESPAQHASMPLGTVTESGLSKSTSRPSTSASSNSPLNTPTSSMSKSAVMSNAPTDSHALAEADHEEKGAAQEDHNETEVRDLGWNGHPNDVPRYLVGGLRNEDLWLLVRRFNKQMYHVKATPVTPLGGLDLNIADEDEFSPDKLRSNIERLYMTVIVGVIGLGKHIARLRSWKEPRRTAAFAAAYLIAWIFNFLIPLFFTILIVLIVFKPARAFMFPPAPLALVNSKTGGIQSPSAGVLGSHDSVTGAPEKHRGEAVEQEASNFVSGFASIALSSAAGKHEQGDPDSDPLSESVPDPTNMALAGADAKNQAAGGTPGTEHDKTKQPMEEAMWAKMRPIMHVVGDLADGWERFANALSPTSPFPQEKPRLKLAGILVPVVGISILTSSAVFVKMTTLFIGIGFFSDPLLWRAAKWLNHEFPHWQKLLEIRNTILNGVPTNAQLTITLLRIGEANRAPLPPPPTSGKPPSSKPASINGDDLTLNATDAELHEAIHTDPAEQAASEAAADAAGKPKHRHGAKVLGFLKGVTKGGVETKFGADKIRAVAGSTHAKNHLGILPKVGEFPISGPVDFKARYKGKKGWVYVSTSATIPCVSFSSHASNGTGEQTANDLKPVFSIPIEEIRELKKIGGLGWKAKLVVGWATDRTVADGLEIVDRTGTTWKLTAISLREELFNRLVAMGGQKWESW